MLIELPDRVYCDNCKAVVRYRFGGVDLCCEECHWIVATFHELKGAQPWIPDADHINALPDPIRGFIHDLETRADPAGDTETIWSQREQIGGLLQQLSEAKAELEQQRQKAKA
jgi:hypothetical protein